MHTRRTKLLILIVLLGTSVGYSQKVTVSATTDRKEIARILAKEKKEAEVNKAYFSEDGRCRGFLKGGDWVSAEASCKLSISLAEKLPAEHVLERSSSRADLAIALLWQERTEEAIPLLKKAVEIRIPRAGEADADTADLYALLGRAYSFLIDIPTARSYYEKADSSYRAAFKAIGDDGDDIRFSYPSRMKRALEAHYELVKLAELGDETERLRIRLIEVDKEFAKYLK